MPSPPKSPPTRERRPDGRITYVVGYSGSGKTTLMRARVKHASRLLVWDGKAEWGDAWGCRVITNPHALMQHCLPGAPPARISYRVPVSREAFATFCRLAWVYIRAHGGPLLVEELADVTTASKAPLEWGEICRKSRGWGSDVCVATQRPQEVDKTVQGNASFFICGMLPDIIDAQYTARRLLLCHPAQVAALEPFQFIERDARRRVTTAFRINKTGAPRAMPLPPIPEKLRK